MTVAKPVVLVIDDDRDFVEATRLYFDSQGYTTRGAYSAEEGLAELRRQSADVLLVDMMMEEIDAGPQLVKTLRADGTRAPIFLLSSMGDQLAGQLDPSTLGVDGVLQKPVDYAALHRVIQAKQTV